MRRRGRGSNWLVGSKLPFPIEPESLELSVIAQGEDLGDAARIQRTKPNSQRFQFLKRATQKIALWTGDRAGHDGILSFPIKWPRVPDVSRAIWGGDREDSLVDPKVPQVR